MKEKNPLKCHLFEALGIIVPMEWDPNGKPCAWAISTYDENLYRIDTDTGKGRSLSTLMGQKVRLFGFLNKSEDGRRNIMVENFKMVDDMDSIP